jgi:hypothetical protein
MRNLFLPINKSILKLNIIFSASFAFLFSVMALSHLIKYVILLFILVFVISILSAGFFLSVFFFELSRKNEYYFYYNLGLSKIKLLFLTYLLHIIFILPFLIILYYVNNS